MLWRTPIDAGYVGLRTEIQLAVKFLFAFIAVSEIFQVDSPHTVLSVFEKVGHVPEYSRPLT